VTLKANDGTTTRTFTIPTNLTVDTANKFVLFATPGFRNLQNAPTPDYTLPCGPFFDPNGATITITFGNVVDEESFSGSGLPKDGVNSLTDTTATAGSAATFQSGTNSPTNIFGVTGPITLTANQLSGTDDACDDGAYCNGVESCSAGACTGLAPCPQQCIEATDTCVECINAGHCNDNNPCTDDVCNGSNICEHTAHVGSCDDGLFCNGTDTCSGTTCTHAGDPCAGINCNEGPDTCANCTGASDCEDGESCTIDTCSNGVCNRATAADGAQCDTDATFCNGVGSCTGGVCGGNEAPCDPATSMCDETNDACSPLDVDPRPDAGAPVNPVAPDDEGGCCQANTTPAVFTGPLLVVGLAFAFGRRRRRGK
jgi:MYXO-CTERM domain-containing protein